MKPKPDVETISSKVVYENRWMKVREDRTRLGDGSEGIYGYVEKPDFVVIAPIDEGRVHVVQQYRYPVKSRHWEFPQGSWECVSDADPRAVAAGELEEETGLKARDLISVGLLHPLYGTANQSYRIFLATGFQPGQQRLEATEQDLVTRSFSLSEFEAMLISGEISDAATVASFGLIKLKGLI